MAEKELKQRILEHYSIYRDIVDDFDAFISYLMSPHTKYIRVNTLKATPNEVVEALEDEGVFVEETPYPEAYRVIDGNPAHTIPYLMGDIIIQDIASMAVSRTLSPEKNSLVIDACAAPGGKTTHIAQIMENTGKIVANDRNFGRLSPLVQHIGRLGVINTVVTCYDARSLKLEANYILADVPCSSEGSIRKDWGLLNRLRHDSYRKMVDLQKGIASRMARNLKPGGVMVYSTCTFSPEENEGVVSYLIKKHNLKLLDIDIPLEHSRGIEEFTYPDGAKYVYGQEMKKTIRIYPHQNDSGGMFIAALQKPDSE